MELDSRLLSVHSGCMVKRFRQVVTLTLDPAVTKAAKRFAEKNATTLSGLVEALLRRAVGLERSELQRAVEGASAPLAAGAARRGRKRQKGA